MKPIVRFDARLFVKHADKGCAVASVKRVAREEHGEKRATEMRAEHVTWTQLEGKIEYRAYHDAVANAYRVNPDRILFRIPDVDVWMEWTPRVCPVAGVLGETTFLMTSYLRRWQELNMWIRVPDASNVFDIGVGTGRSEPMWRARNLRVWGVEPDPANYRALRERHRPNLVDAWNMPGESREIQRVVSKNIMQAVVMSYAITFFFESRKKLDQLVDNVVHALAPGGVFVCIGFDGQHVREWFQTAGKGGKTKTIDNACFRITSDDKSPMPKTVFGQRIRITMKNPHTLVRDQTEYLTDFDELERTLRKRGFRTVESRNASAPYYLAEWPARFVRATRLLVMKAS